MLSSQPVWNGSQRIPQMRVGALDGVGVLDHRFARDARGDHVEGDGGADDVGGLGRGRAQRLIAAKAQVSSVQAQLDTLTLQLTRTQVIAPVDGLITARNAAARRLRAA